MTSPAVNRGRGRTDAANPKKNDPLFTVALLLDVFRRWAKFVIPAGLLLAAVAGAAVFLTFTPEYRANVLMWIDDEDPYLVSPNRQGDRNYVRNQIGFIRSSLVLGPVTSRPEIAGLDELQGTQDRIGVLQRLIRVSSAWGTEHYHISCSSTTPENAKAIANAVADSYIVLMRAFEQARTQKLLSLLDVEREASEREVERLRDNVSQMTVDQTGRDPFGTHQTTDAEPDYASYILGNLQSQLTDVKVQQVMLRTQMAAMENYTDEHPFEASDAMVEDLMEQYDPLKEHKAELRNKRAQLEEIADKLVDGDKSARYKSLQQEIQDDEVELTRLEAAAREKMKQDLQSSHVRNRAQQVSDAMMRMEEYAAREPALEKAIEEELKKAKVFTGETLQLAVKRAELARATKILDRISDRAFMLRTEQRAPQRVELLERASTPLNPIEFLPYKQIGMASAVAFALPYLLALLWELCVRRISSSDQLERKTSLAVVGEIASLPRDVSRRRAFSLGADQQLRMFEESVESLRTFLVLTESLANSQVLAVSSAVSSEGKTTLACQLAISLARSTSGLTLLIEADLRAPKLAAIFELNSDIGLADVLAGRATLAEAAVPSWEESLHIVPAGRLEESPHRLVGNGVLQDILEEARNHYQHIIIDTPPVLATSESLMLAATADSALLCARRDVSREDQVQKAHRRLNSAGANVVGCVFSGLTPRSYAYRYGGYRYGTYGVRDGKA